MIDKLKYTFPAFISSIMNSYTQVFFSNHKWFALILFIVSFFDMNAGICGLLAVIITNTAAYLIGFNRFNIKSGFYGFNALLVGLGIGIYYQPSAELYLILLFVALFTLFVTVSLEGVIGKYGLPYLSISFLFAIWVFSLASREFASLSISERGIYSLNEMYLLGGIPFVKAYEWFNNLNLHESINVYFRSLGAIFFQYHIFAGIILAIGLLIYSRLAFLLSIIGFYAAYAFYEFIGADFNELTYSYIGFNFILASIAIGGFFIIPSRYSVLWIMLLTPLIAILVTSLNSLFMIVQLPIYSLPFNLIVILFLYILKFRERFYTKPELVSVQQFSPELNLYSQENYKLRFKGSKFIPVTLPFFGEWIVTQAHSGEHTHKGEWKHAWDFEIVDEEGSIYRNGGTQREEYYCYNKPVVAVADGWVEEIVNGIEENQIGDMNMEENWGNAIIIKHADGLYSKLSHLKKNSFKHSKGDFVKKGEIVGTVGNSGRSPVPHLHFQMQANPFVGSKTLDYPIENFITNQGGNFSFQTYGYPEKDHLISNVEKNDAIYNAYHFIPGQILRFDVKSNVPNGKSVEWSVLSDSFNNTYLQCKRYKSKAYFKSTGNVVYFTHFEGNKRSKLFYFFLANYKVVAGYYNGLSIKDRFPVSILRTSFSTIVQDFISPFYTFIHNDYEMKYVKYKDDLTDASVFIKSELNCKRGKHQLWNPQFEMQIKSKHIEVFRIKDGKREIELTRKK